MNINHKTSHASAFISSTFLDLREERKTVAKVLKEANLNINALDIKPASNNKSKDEILTGIEESDFIILIVGQCYGSIIPEMTGSDKLSITKWEYIQAKTKYRKNIIVFFKESDDDSLVDHDAQSISKSKLLGDFKTQLSKNHKPKYFSTISELEEAVKQALILTYRAGVTSLLSQREELKNENRELKQENERLKHASSAPVKPNILGLSGLPDNRRYGLLGSLPSPQLGTKKETTDTSNNFRDLGLLSNFNDQAK